MALSENLKSKKLRLGMGIAGAIILGLALFKFMVSGGEEVQPKRTRSTARTHKPVSKPKKQQSTPPPLFEALKEWKDPFRGESAELLELQNKINATKKEIEFLQVSLEAKKLRQQLEELAGETVSSAAEPKGGKTQSPEGEGEVTYSSKRMMVRAILITDEGKTALIVSGDRKRWVHEGEEFDGWEVKEIKKDGVILFKAGKTFVLFYDGFGLSEEGRS